MEKEKIYLVTGAAGFLGGTVCRKLIERGENVRAFVLKNDPAIKYIPKKVEKIEGDLCDIKSLGNFFNVSKDLDIIVLHIASIVTVNPNFNQKVIDVNVGGTKNIIDLCLKHNVKKLVYCSSTGAIPEMNKGEKITIPTNLEPGKVVGCYSKSKAMATIEVLNAVKNKDLNACVVYPSGIMGPEDYALGETTKTLIKIIKGEMPVGISGTFNLCDVRDLADGLIKAADKGNKGENYILGNEAISFKEFCKLVSEESNCKKVKLFLPGWFAYILAKKLEKKAKKKGEKPMMTSFSVYNLIRNNEFDSSNSKKELGYTTRSYRETIVDEIRWLKKEGKI
mgnify:CR=1 FL=1